MSKIRQLLMKYTPEFMLVFARDFLKSRRRKQLQQSEKSGKGLTKDDLINELKKAGIHAGDVLLVHCSLSKIGFIEGGPSTLLAALIEVVGKEGTLMMPAFPAEGRNLDYLEENPVFDVRTTPSRMGILSELFRRSEGVFRSIHPTDSVCAKGKYADWITSGHRGMQHPYGEGSPFRRLCDKHGKILMLGTTLNGACTNLHTLEDYTDHFLYPVYMPDPFPVIVIDEDGKNYSVSTLVHNPQWSAKRNADALKPMFIEKGALTECKIGNANSMLIDAAKMLEVMHDAYVRQGVTMYTPNGGPLPS